ncbi:hypothetical protein [Streptococcus caballi]|uniref:hypothetical protein n=1 Tax=Streptococcus caballi TaxID=439220 RepID=UPI0030B83226
MVGQFLTLIGTILTPLTDNDFYDALSGLLLGFMLCLAALLLVREFYSLLVGKISPRKIYPLSAQSLTVKR